MDSREAGRADVTAHSLRGMRILVAEDEALIALELASILAGAGAEVVGPAMTVKDALARANQEALSGAILDVSLRRDSVTPVAQQLARRGIPFVFYTGQVDLDAVKAEWPASVIISKPASQQMLIDALAQVLEQRRTNSEVHLS